MAMESFTTANPAGRRNGRQNGDARSGAAIAGPRIPADPRASAIRSAERVEARTRRAGPGGKSARGALGRPNADGLSLEGRQNQPRGHFADRRR
ncbi:MAG: hypothetical protein ACLFTG_02115 [Alphaproteobacteria bacterium]